MSTTTPYTPGLDIMDRPTLIKCAAKRGLTHKASATKGELINMISADIHAKKITYTIADVATYDDSTLRMVASRRGMTYLRAADTETLRSLIQIDMKGEAMKAKGEVEPEIDETVDDDETDCEATPRGYSYGEGEVEDDDEPEMIIESEAVETSPVVTVDSPAPLTPAQKAKATLARRAALWARCEARAGWEPLRTVGGKTLTREVVVGYSVGEQCSPTWIVSALGEPYEAADGETVQLATIMDRCRWKNEEYDRKKKALREKTAARRAKKKASEQARLDRAAARAQAKLDRAERKITDAREKNDRAIETLTSTVIAPTDDYRTRSSGVMRAAHAIARLAVDGGSANPYRKAMGGAMRALWAILKAGETISGVDYLDDLTSPQTATVEPVDAIDVDAIKLPDDWDEFDDAPDLYSMVG